METHEASQAPKTTDDVVHQAPLKVEESDDSELGQNILKDQDSNQDFSDDQAEENIEPFKPESDEEELVTVVNPILFTEHIAIMGRVPLRKYFTFDAKT